ncbi:MAG: LLM class F420-dependent oxidoreductase [Acidimicrobiales bacterium]
MKLRLGLMAVDTTGGRRSGDDVGHAPGDQTLGTPLAGLVAQLRSASDAGMASVWLPQTFGLDALTAWAAVGREVPGIELGTAVVPTYPRHPMVLAGQALTTQAATGGRLTLGIGLSHQIVIEGMFGYSFSRPARHMEEYLSALLPLLRGEAVEVRGETVTCVGTVSVDAPPCPVLVAALGPRMLRLAGQHAAGTVTWMTGHRTIAAHISPTLTAATREADRPDPRIVAGLPVCVTDKVDDARDRAGRIFAIYGTLPSYRAMLDREGAEGPPDVALIGDEEAVSSSLARFEEAGATDFIAAPFGAGEERDRTVALLGSLASDRS